MVPQEPKSSRSRLVHIRKSSALGGQSLIEEGLPAAMVLTTRVTKLLNIEHPIIMGGMTGVGTPELCAAVSAAGGLGTIAAHNVGSDPEVLREWIREVRRRAPGKPFGVNFTILPSMGKPPPYEAYAKIVVEEGVKVVETAGSNPKKWVTFFKDAGCITIHKCVSIRHALSAERLGVDVVSLDGFECAGHPGEDDIGNLVLQARGAQELKVPFVCSGGVGDGRQVRREVFTPALLCKMFILLWYMFLFADLVAPFSL